MYVGYADTICLSNNIQELQSYLGVLFLGNYSQVSITEKVLLYL